MTALIYTILRVERNRSEAPGREALAGTVRVFAAETLVFPTGLVTVRIREEASTLVVHRLPWTEDFATVVVTEVAGPPSL